MHDWHEAQGSRSAIPRKLENRFYQGAPSEPVASWCQNTGTAHGG